MDAMAALSQSESIAAKYESPYAPRPSSQGQPLKRRYFESVDKVDEIGEKRQRVEVDASDGIDLDALIAQASSAAVATVGANSSNQGNAQSIGGSSYGSMYPYDSEYLSDPQVYMRLSSSPILENLSTQILSLMVHGTYEETVEMFTNPQSDKGQQYQTLRSLLDQTKKMYNTAGQKSNFLQTDKAYTNNEKYQTIIWSTNLAILVSAIFGGTESDWEAVHTLFLEILVPRVEDLDEEACELYLSFGTQMLLSSLAAEEQQISREESLDHFFPPNLDVRLISRHPGQVLTPIEFGLVQQSMARRKVLDEESNELESLAKLMQRYTWDDFLASFFRYVKNMHQDKIPEYKTPSNPILNRSGPSHDHSYGDQGSSNYVDMDALVNGAVNSALQGANTPNSAHAAHQASIYGEQYASGAPAVPSQSKPTAELYELARQQAASKNSSNNRRGSGGLSARRPWSNEEENALMAGLDSVKGPHWSQILSLYGPSGSISKVLEHRNQVQLKDKARNLKLFFLKSGIEVPYYLSSVTGELKTRAPSQAARKEAEERAKLTSDEQVSRANGILMLASGFQPSSSNHGLPQIKAENGGSPNVIESIESPHGSSHGHPHLAGKMSPSSNEGEMHAMANSQTNGFTNEGLAAALKESIRMETS